MKTLKNLKKVVASLSFESGDLPCPFWCSVSEWCYESELRYM